MKASRLLILVSCLFVFASAPVSAQEAAPNAPKADVKTPRGATARTPKARPKRKAPEGPFLAKPYLQLGHTQARGSLHFFGTPRTPTPHGPSNTDQGPASLGKPPKPHPRAASRLRVSSRTGFITWP